MRDERVRILHILPRRDLHHREAYLFKMRCKFIPNCLLICVPRREFPHVKARKQPCLAEEYHQFQAEGTPLVNVQNGSKHIVSHSERSEEHTSELQSLMPISYAVFCLKKKK